MDRVFDWIGERLKDLDVDISVTSGGTTIEGTTEGATGRPGVWWESGSSTGRLGDIPARSNLLLAGAALAALAVLS